MNFFKLSAILCLLSGILTGCSGTSINKLSEDTVISRSDFLEERPSWVKEETTLTRNNGYLYFLGQAKLPAEKANIPMGFRIAENNAKNTIAGAINQNLTYIMQNAEEGLTLDTNQIQFVSTEAAKALISGAIPSEHYWEKIVSTVTADGDKEVYYSIFARIQISEKDFKNSINRTLSGNKGISADFKKKVDEQWDKMVQEQYPTLD